MEPVVSAEPGSPWESLRDDPGLCRRCSQVLFTRTRRGPAYIRCGRAQTDGRLSKYPRLPVESCVGFEPIAADAGPGLIPDSRNDRSINV